MTTMPTTTMKVADLMTPEPETVRPSDLLSVAVEKMRQRRLRRLPVIDDGGRLVGIITDGDLRRLAGYVSTTRAVWTAMVADVVTISTDAPPEAAAELMVWYKIGGLPVVDGDGRLVGIITETDLLRLLVETRQTQQPAERAKGAGAAT